LALDLQTIEKQNNFILILPVANLLIYLTTNIQLY